MLSPNIFREYDIRGIADKELPDDGVRALGRAFGTYLTRAGASGNSGNSGKAARKVNLARDCRLSSPVCTPRCSPACSKPAAK